MNDRVKRLREESVETEPYISTQRATLLTEFYKSDVVWKVSTPVCRAMALMHLVEKRTIYIGPGELIVGERGPAPKATPTYPELCCHNLEDLHILNSRQRTAFRVSDEALETFEREIIPFWTGRTIRDRVFGLMTEPWHEAFEAGVFTEFMEQRSPGHAILDEKIYRRGFLEVKEEIARRRRELDYLEDAEAYEKNEEYKAMEICCDAVIRRPNGTPRQPARWPRRSPIPSERGNCCESPRYAKKFLPTHRPTSMKPCSATGSFTWVLSPN